MCFRPSAVKKDDSGMQQATCPTCGMPVMAEAGVSSGTCPYCGNPIPENPPEHFNDIDPSHTTRIL